MINHPKQSIFTSLIHLAQNEIKEKIDEYFKGILKRIKSRFYGIPFVEKLINEGEAQDEFRLAFYALCGADFVLRFSQKSKKNDKDFYNFGDIDFLIAFCSHSIILELFKEQPQKRVSADNSKESVEAEADCFENTKILKRLFKSDKELLILLIRDFLYIELKQYRSNVYELENEQGEIILRKYGAGLGAEFKQEKLRGAGKGQAEGIEQLLNLANATKRISTKDELSQYIIKNFKRNFISFREQEFARLKNPKAPKKPVEALLNYLNSKSLEQGEFYITQSTKPL